MTDGQTWYRWDGDALELRIQVRTRSRKEGLEVAGDILLVRVNAPPVDGKANERLLSLLAKAFGVAVSRVRLVHGARSRRKRVRIVRPGQVPDPLKSALRVPVQVEKT